MTVNGSSLTSLSSLSVVITARILSDIIVSFIINVEPFRVMPRTMSSVVYTFVAEVRIELTMCRVYETR